MRKAYESVFGGINRMENASPSEFVRCENVTTKRFPIADCGLGEETVITTEKRIARAFASADNGEDYTVFEGVYDDGEMVYMGKSNRYEDEQKSISAVDADSLRRIGSMFYCLKDNWYTKPVGDGRKMSGSGMAYVGTIGYRSEDSPDVVFNYQNTYLGFTPEVGMTIALKLSDEYKKKKPSSVYLDTFMYSTSNVDTYTITSVSTGQFICTATTYGGEIYDIPSNYTFVNTDKCYVTRKMPNLTDVCMHINRTAGVSANGSSIVLSKPGEYSSFYDFSGESTDSYSVELADGGRFYGITSYKDALIVFRANAMYALWGDTPAQFSLTCISSDVGSIDSESICQCRDGLYFLSSDGFCEYKGASPVCISKKLDRRYVSAKTASDGTCVYALCTTDTGQRELVCYDTVSKLWYSLSYLPNDIFCQNNRLYLVYDNEIRRLLEASSTWVLESGFIREDFNSYRAQTELVIRAIFYDDESFIKTYTAVDNGEFTEHISIFGKGVREFSVPVRFLEGKFARYALVGSGRCRILDITRVYTSIE